MPWTPPQLPPPPLRVSMASSYASKLALFRARFACRADVWAKRWTSARSGRSGFSPACGNEWRPGFCPKPVRGCSACRSRAWLPLTDETVRWHLLGATPSGKPFALGGYPVLPGDDCRFAALAVRRFAGSARSESAPYQEETPRSPRTPREKETPRPPRTPREEKSQRSLREIKNAEDEAAQGSPRSLREIKNAGDEAAQGSLRSLRGIQRAAIELGVPAMVMSALDGDGFLLWWFFSAPVSASLARSLVSACLTAARRAGAPVPFSAWDGIVPERSTVPVTGPGAPLPLPLQGEARRRGLGVPLDPATLAPLPDPWAALSAAPVLDPPRLERVVEAAQGRVHPVASVDREQCAMPSVDGLASQVANRTTPDETADSDRGLEPATFDLRPSRVRVSGTLSDRLRIPLAELPPGAAAALEETAAFLSPVFEDADRMRRPVRGIPRIESHARVETMSIDRKAAVRRKVVEWARGVSAEAMPGDVASVKQELARTPPNGPVEEPCLSLPRGCLEAARAALRRTGAELRVRDAREEGEALEVAFHGELRPAQKAAAEAMMRHDCGVLEAGTAFGKTVLAAWMVAARGRGALVLVNRRTLQRQWVARLAQFLGLREREIGRIGGGARRATGRLDVALLQTLARRPASELRAMRYGFVVVDECHGLPAETFARVADALRARFFLGLSATPVRRDGRHPALALQCGPVRHAVPAAALARAEPFAHVAIVRPTAFAPPPELADRPPGAPALAALFDALCADPDRNARLVSDALACLAEERSPVVLSDRRDHVAALAAALRERGAPNVFELVGGLRPKALAAATAAIAAVPPGEGRVLVATGPLLGEGFDDARLDTLLLATPLSWRGRLAQYAGRLHRRHEGKKEVRIYDYADLGVPALSRMFDKRVEAYAAIGYAVRLPVNAVAGWPASVPVPVDPLWGETYGESARRLCADGADAQLAELFVRAAWTRPPEGVPEVLRARSDAEAFLFRRLETLPAARGRFALNAALPIPLGGAPETEVDLLCRDARLAVELDGAQHLSESAYRRDREKDLALQRHGWLVLRLLASDATARLGAVLDAILPLLGPAEPARAPPP